MVLTRREEHTSKSQNNFFNYGNLSGSLGPSLFEGIPRENRISRLQHDLASQAEALIGAFSIRLGRVQVLLRASSADGLSSD